MLLDLSNFFLDLENNAIRFFFSQTVLDEMRTRHMYSECTSKLGKNYNNISNLDYQKQKKLKLKNEIR